MSRISASSKSVRLRCWRRLSQTKNAVHSFRRVCRKSGARPCYIDQGSCSTAPAILSTKLSHRPVQGFGEHVALGRSALTTLRGRKALHFARKSFVEIISRSSGNDHSFNIFCSDFLSMALQSQLVVLLGVTVPILLFVLYRRCIPKPIPGIPYNKEAIRPFGDVPSVIGHIRRTSEVWSWLALQIDRHQSPITQVFIQPLSSKPTLVIADMLEAQDILLWRSEEFDRAPTIAALMKGLLPKGQVTLQTNHEWRAHRSLLKDLLNSSFLNNVSAPAIYACGQELVELWKKKAELSNGKPFSAATDIHYCALDAIFNITFGYENGVKVIQRRLEYVDHLKKDEIEHQLDGSIAIPEEPLPYIAHAIIDLCESIEIPLKSQMAGITWKVLTWVPWWRKAWKAKEEIIRNAIEKSKRRVETAKGEEKVQCAVDVMVMRELQMSSKAGRAPDLHSRTFYDEVSVNRRILLEWVNNLSSFSASFSVVMTQTRQRPNGPSSFSHRTKMFKASSALRFKPASLKPRSSTVNQHWTKSLALVIHTSTQHWKS